jgi:hypothetical protein
MSNTDLRDRLRGEGLLPFQVQFLERFLDPASPRFWELIAPVGSGKTHLTLALIQQLYNAEPSARVLVLVPSALRRQWQERLVPAASFEVQLLDRAAFVDLQSDTSTGGPTWPVGSVFVTSHDLSAVPVISEALSKVSWDLVVADESQLLSGKRARGFFSMLDSGNVRRALLLHASAVKDSESGHVPLATALFQYGDIVDWNGTPLYAQLPVQFEVISYERSQEERALLNGIDGFAGDLAASGVPSIVALADPLLRSAASSIFAADRRLREIVAHLRPLRNAIMHGHLEQAEYELFTKEQKLAEATGPATAKIPGLYATAESLIALLAEPPVDTKLLALRKHLESQFQPGQAICVWTGLAATAQYLGASLESFLERCYVLTAEQGLAESTEQMKAFERTGGVLITTGAAVQTYSLKFVAGCVNYDLPSNRNALDQRLGRFLRYGRTVAFRTWVLRDTRRSLKSEDDLLIKVIAPKGTVDSQNDWSEN